MGSVVVSWTGRNLDRERQEDLCRRIEPLAVLSHSHFEGAPPIRRCDQTLEGTILVSERIFQDVPTSASTIDEPPDPAVPSFELRVVGRPQPPEFRLTEAFAVSKVALYRYCLPAVRRAESLPGRGRGQFGLRHLRGTRS